MLFTDIYNYCQYGTLPVCDSMLMYVAYINEDFNIEHMNILYGTPDCFQNFQDALTATNKDLPMDE